MPFMPLIAFAITFLALPIVAWSDDSTKPETPTLTVVATGSVSVPPDTAFVTLGMDTAGKSLAEAQRQNSAVMQKVLERFRELKIEKERIQTSAFTVSPQYKPPPTRPSDAPPAPPEIIGYTVSNTMTIEVREIEKVGAVIEEGLSAGANHFHGLRWALRDEQQKRERQKGLGPASPALKCWAAIILSLRDERQQRTPPEGVSSELEDQRNPSFV